MCFPESELLFPSNVAAVYRRWCHGPVRRLSLADGSSLSATVGQPLLSQRSWVQAGQANAGDYLLVTDLVGPPAVEVWRAWQQQSSWTVGTPPHGFWGDADSHGSEVVGDVARAGPLGMSAGMTPPVQARLVREVLAAVSSAAVFGCSTWTRACDTVPGLTAMWPGGEPTARGAGLDAATRARLGDAVSSLPEPANTTERLSERLLGASAGLRLVRVEKAETRTSQSWVVNAASDTSTMIVSGVVAGSAP